MTVQASKRSNERADTALAAFQGSGAHSGDPLRPVMGPGDVLAHFRDVADSMTDDAAHDSLHAHIDYVEDYLVTYGAAYTAEFLFGQARVEQIPAVQDALRDVADEFARRFRA